MHEAKQTGALHSRGVLLEAWVHEGSFTKRMGAFACMRGP